MKIQQRYAKPLLWISALLITALVTGCGGGKDPILGTPEVEVGPLAPTVTAVAPANNASSVAINIKKITATFSKAMDPATLTAASFTLACPVGTPKTGVVTYSESSNVATLTLPAVNLPSNTECTATISTAAKDTAGVALAAPFNWSFTTGLTADTTAPFVIATGVYGNTGTKSGAINQPINSDSTATFSEAMDPETICGPANTTAACPSATYTLVKTSDGTPVPGVVSYIGNTATFNPNSNLAANTTFTSTVTTGAKDLAGNAVATSYIWTWATAAAQDTTAPTISLTNPVHLATNVAINKVINTTFSEEMKQSTIIAANYTVKETVTSINVPGTVTYNVLNHIANFSPQSNLKADTDYTVTVSNKATDLANNALIVPAVGGLPKPNPWTFRTAAAAVPPAPALAINLGRAASFGIASRAGLTSTGVTVINGDVALHPTPICTDATGNLGASQTCLVKTYVSPTGMSVNGSIYWAGDQFDSGATALAVTNDLNAAWVEGKAKVPTKPTVAGDQLASLIPYLPGVYHNANLNLSANGVATFDAEGDQNAVFIFQVDTDFTDSGTLLLPSRIILANGALARNVWFVVGRDITIGSGTSWNGNILAGGTVTVNNGSTVLGRVLGGAAGAGAVTLTGAASPSVTTITVPQ